MRRAVLRVFPAPGPFNSSAPLGGGGSGGRTVKPSNDPRSNQRNPRYANYWGPLAHKRHPPQPAQPRHTNDGAPRTRRQHQQEHRPQQPTQHAKGRTGDCPGPRKETATRRNVTRGVPHHPPPPLKRLGHPELGAGAQGWVVFDIRLSKTHRSQTSPNRNLPVNGVEDASHGTQSSPVPHVAEPIGATGNRHATSVRQGN